MKPMLLRAGSRTALVATLFTPAIAFAAGFALQENSSSGLGNAYASGAAVATSTKQTPTSPVISACAAGPPPR